MVRIRSKWFSKFLISSPLLFRTVFRSNKYRNIGPSEAIFSLKCWVHRQDCIRTNNLCLGQDRLQVPSFPILFQHFLLLVGVWLWKTKCQPSFIHTLREHLSSRSSRERKKINIYFQLTPSWRTFPVSLFYVGVVRKAFVLLFSSTRQENNNNQNNNSKNKNSDNGNDSRR